MGKFLKKYRRNKDGESVMIGIPYSFEAWDNQQNGVVIGR